MKKSLLLLASLVAAGVAMAADGGTITLKTYLSGSNNLKVVAEDPATQGVVQSPDWMLSLITGQGAPVMGIKVGGSGAMEPVMASFAGTTGFVSAGGDWALAGYDQGGTYEFKLAAYKGTLAAPMYLGYSSSFTMTLGGNDLVPPGPAAAFAFGGAQTMIVPVPEPSILALGLLGMGAFLIRRRS